MPFYADSFQQQTQQEKPNWWQHLMASFANTPGIKQFLEVTEPVFNAIDYPWKEYVVPQIMAKFAPSDNLWDTFKDWTTIPGVMNWGIKDYQRQRQEYKDWKSPKYVKGIVEKSNPIYLLTGEGILKGISSGAKYLSASEKVAAGISKLPLGADIAKGILGEAGKLNSIANTIDSAARATGYLENLPGRALSKVFKVPLDILPSTQRRILKNLPNMADDFISKGTYDEAQQGFIRSFYKNEVDMAMGKVGEDLTQEGIKLGFDQSKFNDMSSHLFGKVSDIDPSIKLTGLTKLKRLSELSKKHRSTFYSNLKAERAKRASDAEFLFNKFTQEGMLPEDAYKAASSHQIGSLKDAVSGMNLSSEELASVQMTPDEIKDMVNHLWNTKYKIGATKKNPGIVSNFSHNQAEDALEAFKQLVLQRKPLNWTQNKLLGQAFGDEFVGIAYRGVKDGTFYKMIDLMNMPRALLASFDMSAPFRQGAILQARELTRRNFGGLWESYRDMFKAFSTERWSVESDDMLRAKPRYQQWVDNDGFHAIDESLQRGEELFRSSIAEKIPFIGNMVRRSERAYRVFLNDMRYTSFENTVNSWERLAAKEGTNVTREMIDEAMPALNRLINAASGRGHLPQVLEGNLGELLTTTLFAPRLYVSRFQWPAMLFNPGLTAKGVEGIARYTVSGISPEAYSLVRKEAAKEMASFLSAGAGLTSLLALGGAKVTLDPRSSDFGKIRIGNTRLDVWTGYLQWSRLLAQVWTNQKVDALGNVTKGNRLDSLSRFAQSKFAPMTGLLYDLLKGQSYMGDDMSLNGMKLDTQVWNRVAPLFIQDLSQAVSDHGPLGSLLASPGFFGVGTQTYSNPAVDARSLLNKQFGLPDGIWKNDTLNAAKKIAKPYYAIDEEVWGQYPGLKNINDQVNILEKVNPGEADKILREYSIILQVRNEISARKKDMLLHDPKLRKAIQMING